MGRRSLANRIDAPRSNSVLVLRTGAPPPALVSVNRTSSRDKDDPCPHLEVLDDDGESGRKEHDLPLGRAEAQQLLHNGLELWAQQLVGLVHDKRRASAQIGDTLSGEIEDSSGRADEDMDGLREPHDIVLKRRATGGDHDVDAHVLAERLSDLRGLEGELSRRDEQQRLDFRDFGVDFLKRRDDESGGFTGTVLGLK